MEESIIPAKKLMMEEHWKQKQFLIFYVWLVKLIGRQKFQETEEKSEGFKIVHFNNKSDKQKSKLSVHHKC